MAAPPALLLPRQEPAEALATHRCGCPAARETAADAGDQLVGEGLGPETAQTSFPARGSDGEGCEGLEGLKSWKGGKMASTVDGWSRGRGCWRGNGALQQAQGEGARPEDGVRQKPHERWQVG